MAHWGTPGGRSPDDGDYHPDLDGIEDDFDTFPIMDYFGQGDTAPTTSPTTPTMGRPSSPTTSTSAPTTSTSGENRTRGIATMNYVKRARTKGNLVKLRFNEFGQPIGKESGTMTHFLGTIIRNTISIVQPNTDWRSPTMDQYKEAVWEELTSTFEGIDLKQKKDILSRAGVYHKNFRARLRKLAFNEETGLYDGLPPKAYRKCPMVVQHWREFVLDAMDADFKTTSQRNKEQTTAMKARYRGSSKGLARIREELIEERRQDGCEQLNVSRLDVFTASRKARDEKILDPHARHIIEEAERISQTMTPDQAYTIGPDDVLTRVIGHREHPGRLRNTGHGITYQHVKVAQADRASSSEVQSLKQQVIDLAKQVAEIHSRHRASNPGMSSGASCEGVAPSRFSAEVSRKDFDEPEQNINKVGKMCFLYLMNPTRLVAIGTKYEIVANGYARVTIDASEPGEENSIMPKQNPEANTDGEAIGHFVDWPNK